MEDAVREEVEFPLADADAILEEAALDAVEGEDWPWTEMVTVAKTTKSEEIDVRIVIERLYGWWKERDRQSEKVWKVGKKAEKTINLPYYDWVYLKVKECLLLFTYLLQ